MKFGQITDNVIDKSNVFDKYFALFIKFKSRPVLISQLTGIYPKTNCD